MGFRYDAGRGVWVADSVTDLTFGRAAKIFGLFLT